MLNGPAVATGRDVWVYGSSKNDLTSNISLMIENYNKIIEMGTVINKDPSKISWTVNLLKDFEKKKLHNLTNDIRISCYRPFFKQYFMFDGNFIERGGINMKYAYLNINADNYSICVSGIGSSKGFSCLIVGSIPDYQLMMNCQCFPLYWYEENKNRQRTLFDEETGEDYIRRDGITDWILKEVRTRYHASNITKEMIFYYVYGLLHSEDYRTRFAADLKKSLPRIPIVERVEDFMDFYQYGKSLADLHLNYESVAPYPGVKVVGDRKVTMTTKRDPATGGFIEETTNMEDYDYFRVWDKMRFKSKDDKSTIIYNGNIRIENIPAKAYEYVVNGKSAIEWIVERYCVSQDKKSLIKNDANDWAREHHKPRYILDLLLSVINVSVQTVDIVKSLPKLRFE